MTNEEIKAKVIGILASVVPELEPAELAADKSLRDQLDIDSVDFLNFVVGLSKTFGIEIAETDYRHLYTLDACVAYLAAHATA
ncbi:MAG: acyl carrier protein [Burkholderiales bacterium]|jgi:acyl carrier protein|nr:acyl carrier protein [Burkholderiales bacterium]